MNFRALNWSNGDQWSKLVCVGEEGGVGFRGGCKKMTKKATREQDDY